MMNIRAIERGSFATLVVATSRCMHMRKQANVFYKTKLYMYIHLACSPLGREPCSPACSYSQVIGWIRNRCCLGFFDPPSPACSCSRGTRYILQDSCMPSPMQMALDVHTSQSMKALDTVNSKYFTDTNQKLHKKERYNVYIR